MGTLSASVWYRPVRIGWCIPEGDRAGLREALQLTHTLWGGRYNPVIPVTTSDDFRARLLIESYEVDYLYPVSQDPAVKRLVKQHGHLAWRGLFPQPALSINIGEQRLPFLLDVSHAVRYVREHRSQPADRMRPEAVVWTPEADDPLADALAATHGTYSQTDSHYRQLIRDHLGGSLASLLRVMPFPLPPPELMTPNALTQVGLMRDNPRRRFGRPGFYLGDVSSFTDLVHFWNLRAADIDLVFYDPAHADRLDPARDRAVARWRQGLPDDSHVELSLWQGRQGDTDAIGDLGVTFRHITISPETWAPGGLQPPVMRWKPYTVSGFAVDDRAGGATALRLERKPFDEEAALKEEVAVGVEVSPGPGAGELTYRLPNLPALAPMLSRQLYLQEAIRIGRRGTAYLTNASADAVEVRGWDAGLVVRTIFELAGIRATPSSAGKRATRLIRQMGGLKDCEVFKIAGVRALLSEFPATRDCPRQAALREIGKANFKDYTDLWTIPRTGKNLTADDVFDHLTERGVFRVGLRFECPHCGLTFGISLDEARTMTTCEFCGDAFHVARQLGHRPWVYRRSGLFGSDDDQQGAVPVTLVLRQLYMNSRSGDDHLWLAYTTGMDLEGPDAGVPKCETDLVVIAQTPAGRVEVLIGECKAKSRIEEADVANLRAVAGALERTGVKPFILFSKLTEFTSAEIELIRGIGSVGGERVIMLTLRELEPEFIYERTHDQFDLLYSGLAFSGMAEATRDAFLWPRPLQIDEAQEHSGPE